MISTKTGRRKATRQSFRFWLNQKLELAKIDPSKIAEKAGITRSYMSLLRNGHRRPSYRVVLELTRVFNALHELDVALAAAGLPRRGKSLPFSASPAVDVEFEFSPQATRMGTTARLLDWVGIVMNRASDCACNFVFIPAADGCYPIFSRREVKVEPWDELDDWLGDCVDGWHAELQASQEPVVARECANGLTHLVADVRLGELPLGTLCTNAIRSESFEFRTCFEKLGGLKRKVEFHAFVKWLEQRTSSTGDINTLTIQIRLLAQAIERAAAAVALKEQAAVERAAVEGIASSLSSRLSIEQVLCRILDGIGKLISFAYGNITEVDKDKQEQRVLVSKTPGNRAATGNSDYSPNRWPLDRGVTGWVATRNRPSRVADVSKERRFIRNWPPAQSELAVPLTLDGAVIGVLNLESDEINHFTEHDEQLLAMVAANVATAVERARLRKTERVWRERFTGLSELHRAVLKRHDETSLLQELAQKIVLLDGFTMCAVRVNDPEKRYLLLVGAAHKERSIDLSEVGYKIPHQSLSGSAIQTNHTVVASNVKTEEQFVRKDLAMAFDLRGMIATPIPSLDCCTPPIGCITVYTTTVDEHFKDDHMYLLEDIAAFAGVAHSNLRRTLELAAHFDLLKACVEDEKEETLDSVCEQICKTISAKAASLFELSTSDPQLILRGTTGIHGVTRGCAADYQRVKIQLGRGKTGWVGFHGQPILLVDRSNEEEVNAYQHLVEAHTWIEQISSPSLSETRREHVDPHGAEADSKKRVFLAVPIKSGDRTIGVIRAVGKERDLAFTPLDREILVKIADTISQHLGPNSRV
jgi:GAF domain-containing protein/transcriptional regulator with XRE-family HTH domain